VVFDVDVAVKVPRMKEKINEFQHKVIKKKRMWCDDVLLTYYILNTCIRGI
jgi:rhamnogalacturonyl hydrolase YesR